MDNIKTNNVPTSTITRSMADLWQETGNAYESVMIIAKRANQIAQAKKQELAQRMQEFASYADTLDEVFENREQIELSRFYERMPKSTLIATEEFMAGDLYYRLPSDSLKGLEED